jgi:hypothetical protein
MGEPKRGYAVTGKLYIEDIDVSDAWIRLEWKAFINNGYIVRARLHDPYFNLFKEITEKQYLRKGRNEPIKVVFNYEWKSKGDNKTEDRIAYMINLYARGIPESAELEFIAIDPPTWLLSRGKSKGKYYEGNVSDVIKKVCQENGVDDVEVTNTIDNKNGNWWMMRQDPKTFILSLLDWSTSVTPNKTKWVVNSKDKKLVIKEEHDLESKDLGLFSVTSKKIQASDISDFEVLLDNFSHVLYSEEHTAGLSATSGYFIDQVTEKEKTRVYDKNTGNKTNTKFGDDRGFKVTDKRFSTFDHAIPEESAGNVGLKYQDYIDGRARLEFLDMLGYIMRIRVTVDGDKTFSDPLDLGVSTITLQWIGSDNEPYFLSSHWLITGFWHKATPAGWETDLYINRLDFDAAARKVGPNAR